MATHDYVIANGTGAAVRSDLNDALAAIVSNNSSATEPTTTYAFMWWADTTAGQLKLRNAADNAWVTIQELDGTMLMEDGTVGAPGLAFASDLDTGFYRPAANELGIATNGTNAVYIDDAQQVGIGTTSPGRTLDVNGIIRSDGTSGGLAFGANSATPSEGVAIHRPALNTLAFVTDSTERARIDDSGRLLVGTSSTSSVATALFQDNSAANGPAVVYLSTANATPSATASLGLIRFSANNHSSAAEIAARRDDGTWTAGSSQPSSLQFSTTADGAASPTERMRIDSSGRLLVGTSSAINTAAGTLLQVGDTNGARMILGNSSTTIPTSTNLGMLSFRGFDSSTWNEGARIAAVSSAAHSSTSAPTDLRFYITPSGSTSVSEAMRINSAGRVFAEGIYTLTTASAANVNVFSSGVLSRSTSSSKYKTQIEDLQDSYADALLDCRPVWYRSTCENDNPEHGWWGFIAEEVAEIDPRLVHWKTTEITHDEKGSAVETPCDPEPEGVQYDRFVPHLLNLIKRQQQAIETLEAKVAALESA